MYLYKLVEHNVTVSLLPCWRGGGAKELDMQDLRLQAVPMKMHFFLEMMTCQLVNSFYLPEEFSASMFKVQVTDYGLL